MGKHMIELALNSLLVQLLETEVYFELYEDNTPRHFSLEILLHQNPAPIFLQSCCNPVGLKCAKLFLPFVKTMM